MLRRMAMNLSIDPTHPMLTAGYRIRPGKCRVDEEFRGPRVSVTDGSGTLQNTLRRVSVQISRQAAKNHKR